MQVRGQALQSLTESLTRGNEAVQRAAMYGLSVGGPPAAAAMLGLVAEFLLPTAAGKPLEARSPVLKAADGSTYGLYKSRWHILTSAVFSFGEAVETASLQAVELMSRVVAVANAEIEEHTMAPDYPENQVTLAHSLFSGSKRPGAPHWHFLPCHSFSHTNLNSPCVEQLRTELTITAAVGVAALLGLMVYSATPDTARTPVNTKDAPLPVAGAYSQAVSAGGVLYLVRLLGLQPAPTPG